MYVYKIHSVHLLYIYDVNHLWYKMFCSRVISSLISHYNIPTMSLIQGSLCTAAITTVITFNYGYYLTRTTITPSPSM